MPKIEAFINWIKDKKCICKFNTKSEEKLIPMSVVVKLQFRDKSPIGEEMGWDVREAF